MRLARIALAKTYHIPGIVYQGPQFQKFKIMGDTVIISYQPAIMAPALKTSDGAAPKYFFIAGADKVFHQATARIVNNQVWLYSIGVHMPVAIRYAFTNYPVTNFCNSAGLPAVPFRTDNW